LNIKADPWQNPRKVSLMFWGTKRVIAIGGGKGGVGKSTIAANLGIVMAQAGKRVVVVDADIGAANLHTILGIRYPEKTLRDFIAKREDNLENVLLATVCPGLRLLSSASDVLGIAGPNYTERQRLFRAITRINTDVIIFDIAAGTHQRATDFFSLAPAGIIAVEPVPTSLENAFSFLKNLLMRALLRKFFRDQETTAFIESSSDPRATSNMLQFRELLAKLEEQNPSEIAEYRQQYLSGSFTIHVLVNAVKSAEEKSVADKFCRIVRQYLMLKIEPLGALPYEPAMNQAIVEHIPFILKFPISDYAKNMEEMGKKLLAESGD
jgi:flagellar biosynthesis protein FlhG